MLEISDVLLKQRLRNRIMESLDAFADENVVSILGTDEIINIWYDYMDEERLSFYDTPVFSTEEVNVIKHFHNLLESVYQKVPSTCKLDELVGCKEWSALATKAREGLAVFNKRGLFNEDKEII